MNAYSRGAKRRAKKAAALGLAELAETPKKQPNGRTRRASDHHDQSTEPLKARCRQMGKEINRANMREMRAQWWGCNAGRVIGNEPMGDAERSDLWRAICEMRAITAAYDASCGAPRRHPACLRLLLPVDEMHADASSPAIDTRSDEDKQKSAETRWMRLHGWLGYTDKPAASEAKRVVLDDGACVDPVGLLSALRCVVDGMKDAKPTYRGR